MSFAQGFAAGSAAAQRGVDMGLAMKQRREQEEYQQAVADYNAGLAQQDADLAAYQATEQTALNAGMGLQSPVQPTGVEAQLLNAMPGAAPQGAQMSPVERQQPLSQPSAALGGMAGQGQSMGPMPEVTNYIDRQRGLAAIAMQYGDTGTAISLMNQAQAEERALRTEAAAAQRFEKEFGLAQSADQRAADEATRLANEAAREARLREGKAQLEAYIAAGNTDRAGAESIFEKYGPDGLSINDFANILESQRGITKGDIEAEMLQIQRDLRGLTTTDQLITYYNNSESLSPGYELRLEQNDDGLYQLKHFDDAGKEIDKDVATFASAQEADVYMRQLAVDPATAMQSLVTRDTAIRTTAAERRFEREMEQLKARTDLSKEELKAVASGLENVRSGQFFTMMDRAEQDKALAKVYTDLGLSPPKSLGGLASTRGTETETGTGTGTGTGTTQVDPALARLQGLRTAEQDAEAVVASNKMIARQIVDTAKSMEELQSVLGETSPEVQAEVNALIQQRSSQNRGLLQQYRPYYMRNQ